MMLTETHGVINLCSEFQSFGLILKILIFHRTKRRKISESETTEEPNGSTSHTEQEIILGILLLIHLFELCFIYKISNSC